jgi:hypothetical protein
MRIFTLIICSCAVAFGGCATANSNATHKDHPAPPALLATNNPPGRSVFEQKIYVIAPGDNLSSISKRFDISLRNLMRLNPSLDPRSIQVGQQIRISEKLVKESGFN